MKTDREKVENFCLKLYDAIHDIGEEFANKHDLSGEDFVLGLGITAGQVISDTTNSGKSTQIFLEGFGMALKQRGASVSVTTMPKEVCPCAKCSAERERHGAGPLN